MLYLGFLWFNSSPAEVFTSLMIQRSQSLGASLAVTSILLKQEFVLAVAGGLFVIEAFFSDDTSFLLQVHKRKKIFFNGTAPSSL